MTPPASDRPAPATPSPVSAALRRLRRHALAPDARLRVRYAIRAAIEQATTPRTPRQENSPRP